MSELDAETLNSRLLDGHRLLITRAGGRIVACAGEFFDEAVPQSFQRVLGRRGHQGAK